MLGLHFCARAFSSCSERGPLFIAVHGPLTVAASLVAEHRLQTRRLSSCGSRAQLLRGMWDLPRPGFKPVSPALAGRLPTTAPPGKPPCHILKMMLTRGISLILSLWNLLCFASSQFITTPICRHWAKDGTWLQKSLSLEIRLTPWLWALCPLDCNRTVFLIRGQPQSRVSPSVP